MNSYDQRDEYRDTELSSSAGKVSGIFFLSYHELFQGFEDEICTAGHNVMARCTNLVLRVHDMGEKNPDTLPAERAQFLVPIFITLIIRVHRTKPSFN